MNYVFVDFFELITIFVKMLIISSTSFNNSSIGILVKFDLFNSLSQYLVSLASFDASDILCMKSLLDCAANDSSTLAPMLVPDLNNCFERTYSLSDNNC